MRSGTSTRATRRACRRRRWSSTASTRSTPWADAPGGWRPAAGEDDADHAVFLHLDVLRPGVRARSVLDRVQRAPDPAAVVHGPVQGPPAARGGCLVSLTR